MQWWLLGLGESIRMNSTAERLQSIRVLYRESDSLSLWGIPYRMRPGQQPGDLKRAERSYVAPAYGHYGSKKIDLSDWIWLGTPGWWGHLSKADQSAIQAFLSQHADEIPRGPEEWTELERLATNPWGWGAVFG